MRNHNYFLLLMGLLLAVTFSGCSSPKQPPMPVGSLKLGLAYFTQPSAPAEMLAGYQVENAPKIEDKYLSEMDVLLSDVLAKESQNKFHGRESALKCSKTVATRHGRTNNIAALRSWSAIGRCMGVDLLVVPHLLEFRLREGSDFGVVQPARVVMDIFVLDVRNESLISRSRFDETQSALASNLLDADKFFKRGGKWITAQDLAQEGMVKAVKELGL